MSLVEWFRKELIRIPKSIKIGKHRMDNPLRLHLAQNWYFLRKAVEDAQVLKQGEIPKPYLITQRFLADSLSPQNPTDLILAAREQIRD